MRRLLIATNNSGKIRELRALLGEFQLDLITPQDAGLRLSVLEDGDSYQANAEKKAAAFASAGGMMALADDSGLEVDALEGAPGLHSARFVGRSDATDADRRKALLDALTGKPRPWTARFRCAVAIAAPGGKTSSFEGMCPGEIIPKERGSAGFGYDPVFLVGSTGMTMAELDLKAKNRLSHRAMAVANAGPFLRQLFGE